MSGLRRNKQVIAAVLAVRALRNPVQKVGLAQFGHTSQCAYQFTLVVANGHGHGEDGRKQLLAHHRPAYGRSAFLERGGNGVDIHVIGADSPYCQLGVCQRGAIRSVGDDAPVEHGVKHGPLLQQNLQCMGIARQTRRCLSGHGVQRSYTVVQLSIDFRGNERSR